MKYELSWGVNTIIFGVFASSVKMEFYLSILTQLTMGTFTTKNTVLSVIFNPTTYQ